MRDTESGGAGAEARFTVTPSRKAGWWVCADRLYGTVTRWRDGDFNGTAETTVLDDPLPSPRLAAEYARAMRETAEWLRRNHYAKLFHQNGHQNLNQT